VVTGLRMVTTTTPTASFVQINQGGLGGSGGTEVCGNIANGPAPTASLTFDGSLSCEFTVTSSSNAVSFGGAMTMVATGTTYNRGISWDNSASITTTGTPTFDLILSTAGTNSTWTGENIVVYRVY